MKLRNLKKNIAYLVCEELSRRNACEPLETDFVYRVFPDIPNEKIASSINTLMRRGWFDLDESQSLIYLTTRGRSKIRKVVPAALRDKCDQKAICR
jgi:hypothetical protein